MKRRDSQREVLPVDPCPTIAIFLNELDSYFDIATPFSDYRSQLVKMFAVCSVFPLAKSSQFSKRRINFA
jgi:hypothetical protein